MAHARTRCKVSKTKAASNSRSNLMQIERVCPEYLSHRDEKCDKCDCANNESRDDVSKVW